MSFITAFDCMAMNITINAERPVSSQILIPFLFPPGLLKFSLLVMKVTPANGSTNFKVELELIARCRSCRETREKTSLMKGRGSTSRICPLILEKLPFNPMRKDEAYTR